jgi:hypothetical protein
MSLLTPFGALAALAGLLVLGAWWLGRRRSAAVARTLGLQPPARPRLLQIVAATAAVALLGLAAAQPVLTHTTHPRERVGVQALFVLDTSRSMAASATATSPTRLDRAVAAATKLRAAIPTVPSGIATFTDRVLPDLLPVADAASFDAVAQRTVGIEKPPPADTGVRATSFAALGDIATGNFFAPKTTRPLVVLLTDGESNPADTAGIAQSLHGFRVVPVRISGAGESVYDADGKPEAAYRPDPAGRVVLDELAKALGTRVYDEAGAPAALRAAAGSGPTAAAQAASTTRTPLAPYLAALAVLLLLVAIAPLSVLERGLQWNVRGEGKAPTGGLDPARGRRIAGLGGDARQRA